MLKCPHCGVLLGEVFPRPAPCPFCKRILELSPVVPGKLTVPDTAPLGSLGSQNATLDAIPPLDPPSPPNPSTVTGNIAATLDSWTPPESPSPPPKQPTITGNIAATIDSWSAPEPPAPPKPGTVTGNLNATIDSWSPPEHDTGFLLSPPGGNDPSRTNQDRRIAATIESHDLIIDARQVTGIWSKTITPESKPWQTLKAAEQGSPKDSKLVIKSRALKTASPDRSTGADYELLGVIGEGGMGVVYSARQASIDRNVAIKMLKPEAAKDAERREKFLSEAVVTGDLDHPNIVPIYDLGANESNALFYSMKRVQGTPWSTGISKKSLPENLEVLLKVADAVGFAHARGVVHRDLKPENVMLGEFGEVLVMDWGLALSTPTFRKSDSITQSTSMGGTPAYMAPEMAMGPVEKVGPAADVYLLGAILFEIVAGVPPHAGVSVMSCLHSAARNEIRQTDASGEILEIALRAMATEPSDRYASVKDFQAAIRLYQDHSESIALAVRAERDLAGAVESDDYQAFSRSLFAFEESLGLWDGNDKARAGVHSARLAYARSAQRKGDFDLAASLLTGDDAEQAELRTEITTAQRERDARQGRLRNAKRVMAALAATVVLVITGAFFQVRADRNKAVDARNLAEDRRVQAEDATKAAVAAKSAEEQQRIVAEDRRKEAEEATEAAVAAKAIAVQKEEEERIARGKAEVAEGKAIKAKQAEEYETYVARIGLAAAKIEENSFGYAEQLLNECPQEYRNWEWGRLAFLCRQSVRSYASEAPVDTVAFAPDGERFASGSWDGQVRIWNTDSGEATRTIPYGATYIHSVAFSPDGKHVAAGGSDKKGFIKVWNAATGKLEQTLGGHGDAVLSVVYSRDGQHLLSTSYDNTARLWDVASGRELRRFEGHSWWVWSAAFSPDESQIATASQDGTVRIWQVADTAEAKINAKGKAKSAAPLAFTGHRGPVYSVAFSHDGKQLASGGYDNRVLVWDPTKLKPFDFDKILSGEAVATPEYTAIDGHNAAVRSVGFSRDDKLLVSGAHDNTVRVWDVVSTKPLKVLRGHAGWVRSVAFSPDAHAVLSGSHDHTAKLWSIAGYEEVRVLRGRVLDGHEDAVLAASFSQDGKQIATASRDRTAKTWDFATGKELHTFREGHEFLASSAAFSRDGKRLITAAIDNTTRMWDVATGTQLFVLEGTGRSAALALSPDGTLVLTGSDDKNATLWDAESGKRLHTLDQLHSEITAVAFSPDGSKFFTGDVAGRCRVWETATRKQLWSEDHHNGRITAAAFTPDGQRLLTASVDKTVGQWEVASGKEELALALKHPDAVTALAIDREGRYLATSCYDNKARVWSLADGKLLGTLESKGARINSVGVSPDGTRAITVGDIVANEDPFVDEKNRDERRPLVRLWDVGSGKPLGDIKVRGSQVWAAVFSPDGAGVLTVGGSDARLWDLASGVQRMSFSPNGAVASANFSPDGKRLVTGSWDNSAKIWNATSGKAELKLANGHSRFVNSAIFSPNGQQVLTASDDKTAKLWDAASGEVVRTFSGHADRVRSAVFSSDGKWVLTGSNDKTAKIWNTETGDEVKTLTGHDWAVDSAVFSVDGTRVLTGSEDKSAKVWDVETGETLLTLNGHTAAVVSVALSPDGKRALTASQDNICKLWDPATGKEILTLKGHTQELTSASFSVDGRYVLTASRDGSAIVWLAEPWESTEQDK